MDLNFCFHQKHIWICNGFVTDGRVQYQTSFFDQFDPERSSVTKSLHIQICFWWKQKLRSIPSFQTAWYLAGLSSRYLLTREPDTILLIPLLLLIVFWGMAVWMSRAVNFNLHATRACFCFFLGFIVYTGWLTSQSDLMFMTYKVVHIEGMDVDFCFHKKKIQICNGFVTNGRVQH